MIYFFTGANDFAIKQRVDSLVNSFLAEHDKLALESLVASETEPGLIIEAVSALPFLYSSKMVIVRDVTDKDLIARLVDLDIPEQNIVIVIIKLDKRAGYYKKIKSLSGFEVFEKSPAHNMSRWIMDYAKTEGGSISLSDARYLIDRVGENQMMLKSELDKLLTHSPSIKKQVIDLLVEARPQSTNFDLLKAVFLKQTSKVKQLYKEQRLQKVEPQMIIGAIGWQLHLLALVKSAKKLSSFEIAKTAKVKLYSVEKSMELAKNLSMTDIKRLVKEAHQLDIMIKSTNVNADQAVLLFLNRITS